MSLKKSEVSILNIFVYSMRELLSGYAIRVIRGLPELEIDNNGKIKDSKLNFKDTLKIVSDKYQNLLGNLAVVKAAESLAPIVKKNKGIKSILPRPIIEALNNMLDVEEGLNKWGKTITEKVKTAPKLY